MLARGYCFVVFGSVIKTLSCIKVLYWILGELCFMCFVFFVLFCVANFVREVFFIFFWLYVESWRPSELPMLHFRSILTSSFWHT